MNLSHLVIRQIIAHNPKRGKSRERFEVYQHAATIGRMIELYQERDFRTYSRSPVDMAVADLRWDLAHGFIKIYERALVEVTALPRRAS